MQELVLIAGSSPHIKNSESTSGIMKDVLIALLPAVAAGIYFFGPRAGAVIIVTVLSSILSEYVCNKAMKSSVAISDFSAAVTGLLLALNLPSGIPLWIAAIGGMFAIVIVKQLFGGIGQNFMNPALAARAFLMVSWPVPMTSWSKPGVDALSSATPLALVKKGSEAVGSLPSLMDMLIGNVGGVYRRNLCSGTFVRCSLSYLQKDHNC